jgi:hypothetical protein
MQNIQNYINILLYFLILHSKISKINDQFKYYKKNLEYIFAYVICILNRICTRISHTRYTVVNRTYIEIRILKPWDGELYDKLTTLILAEIPFRFSYLFNSY